MIPKSGNRFSDKIMLRQKFRRVPIPLKNIVRGSAQAGGGVHEGAVNAPPPHPL
jgi:hypothetical protein